MPDATVARDVAFTEFYGREHDRQVRRAFTLLRSNEAANDIVHDAMIEVYTRWADVREPGAYLNRAVLNRCRDLARHSHTHERAIVRLSVPSPASATEDPLDDMFDRLPFNQRAAVVLRFYADLSTAEIADALGCPQGSVGPWIDRAITRMRRDLTPEETS